jgi:tRNA (pseudouridine54-N1)-methyltransferase
MEELRTFVLRAREAPTNARRFLEAAGSAAHVEIIAQTIMSCFYTAKNIRRNAALHIVLESSPDFPRIVSLDSRAYLDLPGFEEPRLLSFIAGALDQSQNLAKDEARELAPGLTVRAAGFDRLVHEFAEGHALYLMDRRGGDIRGAAIAANPVFILTDHIPMPVKSSRYLRRLGAQTLSLGPKELFAYQCIVLLHSELDRRP